ncbi:MAG: phosphoribosylanthranilate isomerase [Rubrivivax sp.]|nr:phosphoribosylanthranilate isomerase [Rubrivivax sp.]
MSVAVKVCCIADVDEARWAVAAGASALGLVSAMPSGPGVISDDRVAEVAAAVRDAGVRTFLLTARTRAADIAAQHRHCGTTTLQLVDHVPLAELARLRELCPGVELVQVVHVTGEASLDEAHAAAPHVDALLLDSGNPALSVKQLGGTGRTHDWALSRRIRDAVFPRPLWLAGGLHAGNVADAVRRVAPHGVDLCNGVRHEGRLDPAKLGAFMQAVATA